MRNVQAAMFPLLTVLCLCGFGIFEYPRGRPRLYPSILYILITWLLYVYIIIEMRLLLKRFDIEIFLIIKTSIIFVIVTTFFSFHYDKVRHLWVSRNDSYIDSLFDNLQTSRFEIFLNVFLPTFTPMSPFSILLIIYNCKYILFFLFSFMSQLF
jgi:hypothetical protein